MRPVMHRASTVEIIVPYGDPRAPFHKKCAFDVVDYGLGFSCSSLELGCDCLGHIKYFDAMLNTNKGAPMLPKAAFVLSSRVSYAEGTRRMGSRKRLRWN